jgi:DegV family protein with EDD domain
MTKVAIVTDSCASIPENLLESLNIHWVPYYIHRGSEVLRDLVTIQRSNFYTWMLSASEIPKTASPGPGDYLEMYTRLAEQGVGEIASIHMTSKGSAAYQAAVAARAMLGETLPSVNVQVIDTLNASMCHGWMVIEAARAALSGKNLAEVARQVFAMIPITRMIMTADTLKYLYLGGRIGKARNLVGTLLNIKPLISMEDGVIVPVGTARNLNRAYQRMVDKLEAVVGRTGRIKIAYVHAAALEDVLKLRALVEERMTCVEALVAELSPALGVHTGPGTTGFCYFPVV